MNDTVRPPRTADLVALAHATDANGHVDLTAYEAQRLILLHQSVDGLDAKGLVGELVSSPAYASDKGREQIGPLLDAISSRLPATDAARFSDALDSANVNESWLERNYERYVEEPVAAGYQQAKRAVGDGLSWTDQQISDNLAAARRWADSVRDNPQNSYLEHAAGNLADQGAGKAQDYYGAMKGTTSHGLAMLGETVDLAKFAHRFGTDRDFRNLIIGTAAIYASDAIHDPGKPFTDIQHAAVKAWNEWEAGLEQAIQAGKEQEYLGEAKGAAAVEIIATFVPVSKITKLAKVARAVDVADDLVPDGAGRAAARVEGKVAGELAEELVDVARDAARVQARGGLEGAGANLTFSGLAGIKRSQGELRELADGLRKSGDLDGLLQSGALAPRELNYLARQDVTLFDGKITFQQALTKSLHGRELSALKSGEVGDIGEAIIAHDLARKGYRDLVPIQNNSGHGNDLAGINPETGRWEVVEVKASVKGIAKAQTGDPDFSILKRLALAADAREGTVWAPKNMWEEQAQGTAQRILDETLNPETRKVDVDAKWVRVNLERDAVNGELKGTPEIEPWRSPAQRMREHSQSIEPAPPTRGPASEPHTALPPGFAPALSSSTDLRDCSHPGHTHFARIQSEVHRAETTHGIAHGPHSEQVAAALMWEASRQKQDITHVEIQADGKIVGRQQHSAWEPVREVAVDANQALSLTLDQYAERWTQRQSPYYAPSLQAAERTPEQAQTLARLASQDQSMFARIRKEVPAQIDDGVVLNAMLEVKRDGTAMDAGQIGMVAVVGDKLWVAGTIPGFRTAVDVTAPVPEVPDLLQQNQALNLQREQQLAIEAMQREQSQAQSRGIPV